MTRDDQTIAHLNKLKSFHNGSYGADIDIAIKALEQELCEDAISREDALEAILTRVPDFCGDEGGNLVERNETASYIRNLPSVTSKQKWIPVSEELPEEGEEVLVSAYDTYGKKVIIARYQGEKYGFTCGLVSAWMPLPKAYREVEE